MVRLNWQERLGLFLTCAETVGDRRLQSVRPPQRLVQMDEKVYLSTVLLDEVLVRGAVVIGLDLVAVIVGCQEMEKQSDRQSDRHAGSWRNLAVGPKRGREASYGTERC